MKEVLLVKVFLVRVVVSIKFMAKKMIRMRRKLLTRALDCSCRSQSCYKICFGRAGVDFDNYCNLGDLLFNLKYHYLEGF